MRTPFSDGRAMQAEHAAEVRAAFLPQRAPRPEVESFAWRPAGTDVQGTYCAADGESPPRGARCGRGGRVLRIGETFARNNRAIRVNRGRGRGVRIVETSIAD